MTADEIVKEWKEDLKKNPIGVIRVYRSHSALQHARYRRVVGEKLAPPGCCYRLCGPGWLHRIRIQQHRVTTAKHVVRALHVLRSELDAVLHTEFAGRKVRFIGDCVHGLAVRGNSPDDRRKETISNLTLCAAGMRSSFNLALTKLKEKGTDANEPGIGHRFRVWADECHTPWDERRTGALLSQPRRAHSGKGAEPVHGY